MPVEIIGPPGIGKSTLYQAVCRSWTPQSRWTYQEKVLGNERGRHGLIRSAIYQIYCRLIKRSGNHQLTIDHGLRFIQQHEPFAEFIWKHLSDPNIFPEGRQAERFRAFYLLFRDFMRYQAILESNAHKPCIMEEGFLQKSYLLQVPEMELPDWIERYLQLTPKPDLIFRMDASDPDTIALRLELRAKKLAAYQGLDRSGLIQETRKWQQFFSVMDQKIQQQHIEFKMLDGSKPIEENIRIIYDSLEAL